MKNLFFKKFIKLMKGELSRNKRPQRHYSWSINETKYLDIKKVKKLRLALIKVRASAPDKLITARNWFMVELGLSAGLRVEEMTNLRISDLNLNDRQPSLMVRQGKGNKPRTVYFSESFKNECLLYLSRRCKLNIKSDYLFTNTASRQLTRRALQKSFKKCLRLAGLESHYSIHCLRHTYGSYLYKSSNHNLRLVQEQLGHSSIRTTQIYAGVMNDDLKKAVKNLYLD
jgi:site-specific recombinase XerD